MNVFDEREKAFEAKYHLDEELAFKVNVRRDKLLGLWVAEQLGLKGSDADAYARSVLDSDFADPHHTQMLAKLCKDLEAKQVAIDGDGLRRQMQRLQEVARQQVIAEVAAGKQSISPE